MMRKPDPRRFARPFCMALTLVAVLGTLHTPAPGDDGTPARGATTTYEHAGRVDTFWGTIKVEHAARADACIDDCAVTVSDREGTPFRFPVREGATLIKVESSWTPDAPTNRDLEMDLVVDPAEGARTQVVREAGTRNVTLEVRDPAAGDYVLDAWPAAPAGVVTDEDVHVDVIVRYFR